MKVPTAQAGLAALAFLTTILTPVAAHSWIEAAYKIDKATRQFFGAPGYPRGGSFRRLSAAGQANDQNYIWRLPANGFYTGDENINKDPIEANMPDETLEAAPGDYVSLLHLENGHVTKIEEGRPLNAGTIYLYGTSEPKDDDKLFDIHLVWNQDGTGGDKRGKLLGTRNYDDGRCYEGNAASDFAAQRAKAIGAKAETSVACQSDIQLPEDLKPGSTYTVYWYWDWPMLNTDQIDMEGTKKGLFPWMGTFMRGDKDPNGFKESVLMTNESYSSTIDIKIVEKEAYAKAKTLTGDEFLNLPKVYTEAIDEQLTDGNFQVKVDASGSGDDKGSKSGSGSDYGSGKDSSAEPSATSSPAAAPSPSPDAQAPTTAAAAVPMTSPQGVVAPAAVTVTVTQTVQPAVQTSTSTSAEAADGAASTKPCDDHMAVAVKTVVELETQYKTVYVDETPAPSAQAEAQASSTTTTVEASSTTMVTVTRPTSILPDLKSLFAEPTPTGYNRRSVWAFGEH